MRLNFEPMTKRCKWTQTLDLVLFRSTLCAVCLTFLLRSGHCCFKRLVYHGSIPLLYIDDCTSNYDLGLLVGATFSSTIKGRLRDSLAFQKVQARCQAVSLVLVIICRILIFAYEVSYGTFYCFCLCEQDRPSTRGVMSPGRVAGRCSP